LPNPNILSPSTQDGAAIAWVFSTKTIQGEEERVVPFSGIDTTTLLVTGMKVAQDNHRLIANNIANVDTPRYNPVRLDFDKTLRNALQGRGRISLRETRPQHLASTRYTPALEGVVISSKNDYNKVDIDQEIANLAENRSRYLLYGSLIVKQFQVVKNMLANTR
jgi:flagellar basal-body rod protein FlgB